jgi:hypothetical protein
MEIVRHGATRHLPSALAVALLILCVGGFANLRVARPLLAGVGINWVTQTDTVVANGSTVNDFTAQFQCFAALQYMLSGRVFIKGVFGFARADFLPSDLTVAEWHNDLYSGRIRLMYLY